MEFRKFLKENIVILDGGMGTLLQKSGLKPGELPELWNIDHPDIITEIHKAYFDAGSNVVNTNTFGANPLKFAKDELDKIIKCAVLNAKTARENSSSDKPKFISLDIGPIGKMLKPFGDVDFEDAVGLFSEVIKLGVKYGVDLITIETMNDSYETKAAVLAAKENSDLPIIVTNAYGENGKLMTGASPDAMVAMLVGHGVDALGANCSLGPVQLRGVISELLKYSSVPVVAKPNAGMPKIVNGQTLYDIDSVQFSDVVSQMCIDGVRCVGGCCGTNPEYIKKLTSKIGGSSPKIIQPKNFNVVSSYSKAVCFGKAPILIGERINPTGKKRFKQALVEHDIDYILKEGITQQEKGVHILDVNVGLPEINEASMLKEAVSELQAVTDLPLQIDTADFKAMEEAVRVYNGKPMINSVNGKRESMEAIFPIVKKYGGYVVALTLDENGIPNTVEGRINIAKNIIDVASKYGINKNDIIFDTLAMTISADTSAAATTIESLRRIRYELGCQTSLGVSNVSFGLPARDSVNCTFFAMCLANGLSAAIMNPYSTEMIKTYHSYSALAGYDENCSRYISYMSNPENSVQTPAVPTAVSTTPIDNAPNVNSELQQSIIQGRKESAAEITRNIIKNIDPMAIIEKEIIPALDIVGKRYEQNIIYLPQLLISAEAAKASFEIIKENSIASAKHQNNKFSVVIATVKGDIHDIGKNIVKLLLENYGYNVTDLGKDIPPQVIADAVIKENAKVCCLSALMTTTVPAMEETIKLIRSVAPECKIMVGGAVLTKEYADMIGADLYSKDAMGAVRLLAEI